MDRISGLSDELLIKILLFLPTKVAVSTSILSKRWEYLWMWLPKLEFRNRHGSASEWEKLHCFLDRNLPLHRAPVIESFRLGLFSSRFKPESINMWVVNAVYHKLRELEIACDTCSADQNILPMPSNLYTCNSLVILKLAGRILLDVTRMVSLPSLKTLQLRRVKYFKDDTFQRLLSNCPILEDLVLGLREGDTMRKLTVVVPSLQSLSLYIPYDHDIDGYVIETPALKCFHHRDYSKKSHYRLIEHMPNLIEAHLDVRLLDIKSLFGSIASVKRLSLCCSKTLLDEGFVFNQLEHLDLCLCTLLFPDQLVQLLKVSPKLKRLDIFLTDHHRPIGMGEWNHPGTIPGCMISTLQSFSWSKYTGKPQEREIVVYILKHALHLKTATIKSYGSDVAKIEMLKELSLSSRASAACQLMFQ